jgi:hypothetical protein
MFQIVGRRSSLFTRMPLLIAEELAVPYTYVPIYDMSAVDTQVYAGNPALKLPILRTERSVLFGATNICRAIVERSSMRKYIVWPEALSDDVSRNAQELVWHCATTQVQIVMGTVINRLPAENPFFVKARTSLENSLIWLNDNVAAALQSLPPRELSLFEVSLHCLIEHLLFRPTVTLNSYAELLSFSKTFAQHPGAQRTVFRLDVQPVVD